MKSVKSAILSLLFFITIIIFLSSSAFAGDIIYVDVDATGDNDGSSWLHAYTELLDALSVATTGDEIWVAAGTYKPGTIQTDSFAMINGVAIYGGFDPSIGDTEFEDRDWENNITILSGDLGTGNCYHVFYHPPGIDLDDTAILDGFTITKGYANLYGYDEHERGGGMANYYSSPTIANCKFSENRASYGGGVYNEDNSSPIFVNCEFSWNESDYGAGMYNVGSSSPILTKCTFEDNFSSLYGGGMYNRSNSGPTITDCHFDSNDVGDVEGGGIFNYESSPVINNCTFSENIARSGGGICNTHGSLPTIAYCSFLGNIATLDGWAGGMANYNSSPVITSCFFSGNSSRHVGGMVNTDSSSIIENCIFSGNSSSEYGGGGILIGGGSPAILNCIFYGNTALDPGGGILITSGSTPIVINCTFYGNFALNGGGLSCEYNSFATVLNTILWNDNPDEIYVDGTSSIDVIYSDIEGGWQGLGNKDEDPDFVDPTNWDFHLQTGSPCIDSGMISLDTPKEDLDGTPRPIDGNHDSTSLIDMGAYEYAPQPDIKANGSDGPITISRSDNLIITVSMDPKDFSFNIDGWLVAKTSQKVFHYNMTKKSWEPGLSVTYQGYLRGINSHEVWNASGLPKGTYEIFFGIDLSMDGEVTWDSCIYDKVKVYVIQ